MAKIMTRSIIKNAEYQLSVVEERSLYGDSASHAMSQVLKQAVQSVAEYIYELSTVRMSTLRVDWHRS